MPQGPSIFNVAIRTLQLEGTKAIYGVGGGITWDSNWEAEYEETKQKAAVLYRQKPQIRSHFNWSCPSRKTAIS